MMIWTDDYNVGHRGIDEDHQRLVSIINEFEEKAGTKSVDALALHDIIITLHDYSIRHFAREEKIQDASAYPNVSKHREEHAAFIERIVEMANAFIIEKTEEITPASVAQMVAFLNAWLIDHILKMDFEMRGYIPTA
jgi:hemerythrin